MKIGMSGIMFDRMSIESSIDSAACIGFDGIELRGNAAHLPHDAPADAVARIRRRAADAGLAISSIASFTGHYGSISDEECGAELEKFRQYVRIAAELGAPNVRHWTGRGPSREATEAQWERAAEWLAKAADYAAGFGVAVALELHHNTFLDCADAALKTLEMAGRKNIGLIHDGVNYYFDGEPAGSGCIGRLGKRIINVHMKDVVQLPEPVNPATVRYNGRYFVYRTINEGGVDQYGIVKALVEIGYDAYLTVESSNLLTPFELAKNEYLQICKIMNDLGIERK